MRASRFLVATLRETPADAVIISHQLMLRAGLIRKVGTGLYNWLPLGVRVLQKVQAIIRQEMNHSNALEVLMPVTQPAELWQESGRHEQYGAELLRFQDRHHANFVLGPTHEEVITDLARNELHSYKQLPINFYQIQTKFRDEIRPRFGVMRSREFIMKDAYSFHANQASLQETYDVMYDTYCRIFSRIGVDFRPVQADTGSIGGDGSHEFHVLADSGEDLIAFSDTSNYAANIEMAEAICNTTRPTATQNTQVIDTPNVHSISDVCEFLKVDAAQTVKTLIVRGVADDKGHYGLVALVVRGDHELNAIKAEKLAQVGVPLAFASDAEILATIGCNTGSIGPQGLTIPVLVDRAAAALADFVTGANVDGKHMTGVNWQRDAAITQVVDIRNVVAGDASPDGQGHLVLKRGIEVGHIFQLGTKYSQALNCTVLGEDSKPFVVTMGCYGIGVTRVVAAAIEQNYDEHGIIWPDAIAPFHIALVPMNWPKSPRIQQQSQKLYEQLTAAGYEVFFDDRHERAGVKFADIELIGIPHRLVMGEKGLDAGMIEYKSRLDAEARHIRLDELFEFLSKQVNK